MSKWWGLHKTLLWSSTWLIWQENFFTLLKSENWVAFLSWTHFPLDCLQEHFFLSASQLMCQFIVVLQTHFPKNSLTFAQHQTANSFKLLQGMSWQNFCQNIICSGCWVCMLANEQSDLHWVTNLKISTDRAKPHLNALLQCDNALGAQSEKVEQNATAMWDNSEQLCTQAIFQMSWSFAVGDNKWWTYGSFCQMKNTYRKMSVPEICPDTSQNCHNVSKQVRLQHLPNGAALSALTKLVQIFCLMQQLLMHCFHFVKLWCERKMSHLMWAQQHSFGPLWMFWLVTKMIKIVPAGNF